MRVPSLIHYPRDKRTVAVPMAHIASVLKCVADARKADLADFLLIGDPARLSAMAEEQECDLAHGVTIHEEPDETAACHLAAQLALEGKVQIIMKGLAHTTPFLRALLDKRYRLLGESGLISLVSVFDIPRYHKALFLTDAGINIAPDLKQKVHIIQNACTIARALGIREPRVACIAHSETVHPRSPATVDADHLSRMAGVFGDATVAGPYALDIAVSRESAAIKGVSGAVAGDADVIMLPGLNAGNAVYKTLTVFGGATASGLIAGLTCPVVLTSRADTDAAKILSLRLALSMDLHDGSR